MKKLFLAIVLIICVISSSVSVIEHGSFYIEKPEHLRIENKEIVNWNNFYKDLERTFDHKDGEKIRIIFKDRKHIKDIPIDTEFTSGYALPLQRSIYILLPLRFRDYPINNLNTLIHHELVHIFLGSMLKKEIPVWLNEGLAVYLSSQNIQNPIYISRIIFNRIPKIDSYNHDFYDDFRVSYPLSRDYIDFLRIEYGKKDLVSFVKEFNRSSDHRGNFRTVFGAEMDHSIHRFNEYLRKRYSVLSLISTEFIYIFGALLLIIGYVFYIIRKRTILKRLEDEE